MASLRYHIKDILHVMDRRRPRHSSPTTHERSKMSTAQFHEKLGVHTDNSSFLLASGPKTPSSPPGRPKPGVWARFKRWRPRKSPVPRLRLQDLPDEIILLILEQTIISEPGTIYATLRVSRSLRLLSLSVISSQLIPRVLFFQGTRSNVFDQHTDGTIAPYAVTTRIFVPFHFRPFDGSRNLEEIYITSKHRRYDFGYMHPVTEKPEFEVQVSMNGVRACVRTSTGVVLLATYDEEDVVHLD
ncbi:hypothetical protein BU23DRAFT_106487 [Bimuria novae-zelandiae CBS 107.79]|uniref:F-box domain-containing protein n=1 Tax=Bimuria novae-zelandiae CBS 107.79 TaxID=1447943 RepID=A0A6A5VT88_9PLEO|nr:hypothetical protein BU23DRAFT_106487 [Bimuria novae-zelandiae CBS 107.79]